jgi:hypothetical protein
MFCGCSIMPILGGQNGNSGLKVVFFDTDWLINRGGEHPGNALAVGLMTVVHVFDDEPSAVRSIAWGLRT